MANEHESGVKVLPRIFQPDSAWLAVMKVLPRYFQPDFARLALNLPPSCTFWSAMEDEIDEKARREDAFAEDTQAFLNFLSFFFSNRVLQDVEEKLALLSNSSLGLAYTFRKGKAEVAKAVLADIHGHPALENFFGWVSSTSHPVFSGEQPTAVSAAHADHGESTRVPGAGGDQDKGDHEAASGGGVGGVGGGGGSGGVRRGRVFDDDADEGGDGSHGDAEQFPTLDQNVVFIDLSAFRTPPKSDFNRSQTLKARSSPFIRHERIQGDLTNTSCIYDPFHSERGRVLLYHGARTSSLGSFKSRGISLELKRNEFSVTHAFYTSNSLRQAFEHPMHKHISGNIVDPVSVLVFEVDVVVLNGEKIPIGETSEFKVKWFRGDTPGRLKVWSDFCDANLSTKAPPHSYDVVIGPICYRLEEGGYGKLYGEMPNSIPLTQVALCTPRARAWIQNCFKRVYMERRG